MGLLSNTKAFCKLTLRYLPVLGWSGYLAENPFLQRDKKKERISISDRSNLGSVWPNRTEPFTLPKFCNTEELLSGEVL